MAIFINRSNIERNCPVSRNWSILVLIAGLLLTDVAVGEDRTSKITAGIPPLVQNSPLNPAQLEQLVGPIALYPDDLIGIILPASTKPIQVVQAVRFLDEHENDPGLTPDDAWDDSVIALLNYPEVLRMLDGNLDWTVKLGEAVITQQDQLMDSIQQFRRRANAAGNLKSDDKQTVAKLGDTIEIRPANPEVVYVPSYEPDQVIVSHFAPLYDYYPGSYPVYYYPYAPDYSFSSGFFWGVTTAFIVNWNTHYIHAYRSNNFRHPYYRSNYFTNRFLYRNRISNHNRYPGNWRASGYTRRSGTDRDHRTVTVGSLPQLQSRQIRQFGNTTQSTRNPGLSSNRNAGNNLSTPGDRGRHRNHYQRDSSNTGRAEDYKNRATAAWAQRRSSMHRRDRNSNTRALPRASAAASTPPSRTTSSVNNNSSTNSAQTARRTTGNGNTATRLRLRANSSNSFAPQGKHAGFIRR